MRFTIEVDEDWLDTLESLAELVAGQEDSSPETALEQAIFAQLKDFAPQSIKRAAHQT